MSSKKNSVDPAHDAKICVICCQSAEYFALGRCDHPVCYKCGVRMRILCKENLCSVCRTDLPQLIIMKDPQPFHEINTKKLVKDRKNGVIFDSVEAEDLVEKLLEHKCSMCKDRPPNRTFNQLRDHVKKHHSLFYCDICVDHLKIFSHEHKLYTRKQLATHRRTGDPDDKSHKGHPLCEFCEMRFLDNDELMLHLRKNHLWCHFCEKDGRQDYYCEYESLRVHFREAHFLCEEGECVHEKFTSVFRTQIDYQAHKVSRHSKNMTKAAVRQNRQLEVQINYPRRWGNQTSNYGRESRGPTGRERRGERREEGRGATGRSSGPDERIEVLGRETENIQKAMEQSLTLSESGKNARSDPKNKQTKTVIQPKSKAIDIDRRDDEENKDSTAHQQNSQNTEILGPNLEEKKAIDDDAVMLDKTPISSLKYENDYSTLPAGAVQIPAQSESGKLFKLLLTQESDFPSLPNDAGKPKKMNSPPTAARKVVNKTMKRTEEDFPSLSSDAQDLATTQSSGSSGKMFSKALKLAEEDCPSMRTQSASYIKPSGISTQVFNLQEFPTLADTPLSVSRPAPPPGLNSRRPPPGFEAQSKPLGPPPGLKKDASMPIVNQIKTESVVPLEYSLPKNYQERNKALIASIQRLLGQEKFMQFKTLSGEFRQGHRLASDYYNSCCSLFGTNMKKVFHELVALLPDPLKQQQLLTAHNDAKVLAKQNGENIVKIGNKKSESATPWQKNDNFTSCPHCQQFLSRTDLDGHLSVHTVDQEFPSLSAVYSGRASPGIKQGPNAKVAWVKGK